MVKLLDCTIRDGGHLNGWNFTKECVQASYDAAANAGADYFEIGYRVENPNPKLGDFARCEDDFLMSFIEKKDKCKIAVMIDAGKCSADKFQDYNPNKTPIEIIRIATYPQKMDIAFDLAEKLHAKGYEIFMNFMAISRFQEDHFNQINQWRNKNILSAVWFADSFGALFPEDVTVYGKKFRDLGFNKICFHSHNNLQLAFANSLKAIEKGFYCIDSSIYGMGRNAGNLPAELITGYLNKTGEEKFNPEPYLNVIQQFYIEHFKKTPWGYGIHPLLGGLKNIHPQYIEELFNQKDMTIKDIITTSDLLKKNDQISFSKEFTDKIIKDLKESL